MLVVVTAKNTPGIRNNSATGLLCKTGFAAVVDTGQMEDARDIM